MRQTTRGTAPVLVTTETRLSSAASSMAMRAAAGLCVVALFACPAARANPPESPATRSVHLGLAIPRESGQELSGQAQWVSRIAAENGDRHYIMVDKAHGKLFVFENGRLVYSRAALTGESMADQFPPDALRKTVHEQYGVRYKVTPAGRFTLNRAHDAGLGDTLDINEIRGKDWTIAIHQVWLGNRAEHRDDRLRSTNDQDKHITTGCIDVDASTIQQLLRLLPAGNGIPVYILPLDDSLTRKLFRPRDAASPPRDRES